MQHSATQKLNEYSRRLLAYEGASGKSGEVESRATFRVCEKLRGPLGRLTGLGGFRSLLSRALALAGAEVPWLRALHIKADGSLEGLEELEAKLGPAQIALGETALVSRLLGLLVTFVGTALTAELLHGIWPEMEGLDSQKGARL